METSREISFNPCSVQLFQEGSIFRSAHMLQHSSLTFMSKWFLFWILWTNNDINDVSKYFVGTDLILVHGGIPTIITKMFTLCSCLIPKARLTVFKSQVHSLPNPGNDAMQFKTTNTELALPSRRCCCGGMHTTDTPPPWRAVTGARKQPHDVVWRRNHSHGSVSLHFVSFRRQSQCDNGVEENAQYFEQPLLRSPLSTPSPNTQLIRRKYVLDIHEAPSTKGRNGNSPGPSAACFLTWRGAPAAGDASHRTRLPHTPAHTHTRLHWPPCALTSWAPVFTPTPIGVQNFLQPSTFLQPSRPLLIRSQSGHGPCDARVGQDPSASHGSRGSVSSPRHTAVTASASPRLPPGHLSRTCLSPQSTRRLSQCPF